MKARPVQHLTTPADVGRVNYTMPLTLLLHGKHAGPTTTYEPFGEWIVPWRFRAFDEEYRALRTGVGLIDYSTQATLTCQGADRVDFLQRLLTNDLTRLTPGTGCPAAFLTPSAKLIAELLIVADPDTVWLLCDLPRATTVAKALDRYLFSEQVTVVNHERQHAVLAVQGPRTMELLRQITGTAITLPNPGDHIIVPLQELSIRLIRHSLTGEAGVLIIVDADQVAHAWDLLQRLGTPSGLQLVGWEALNTARIEAGLPWPGIDMDETNLLSETGLESTAVSLTKGCYVGQEIVARMATYGSASKKLVGLLVEGEQVPAVGDGIVRNDDTLGVVTSACRSPALNRPIAMGYVKRGAYEPGTAVEIVRGAIRLKAAVVQRPLVTLSSSA